MREHVLNERGGTVDESERGHLSLSGPFSPFPSIFPQINATLP